MSGLLVDSSEAPLVKLYMCGAHILDQNVPRMGAAKNYTREGVVGSENLEAGWGLDMTAAVGIEVEPDYPELAAED